jgi:hypothetical protein
MRVIVVPADTSQPCTTLTVTGGTWPGALARLVGHPAESAIYDRDAVLWLNGGGPGVLPPNRRATAYAFGQSAAAARNGTDPADPRTGCTGPWPSPAPPLMTKLPACLPGCMTSSALSVMRIRLGR